MNKSRRPQPVATTDDTVPTKLAPAARWFGERIRQGAGGSPMGRRRACATAALMLLAGLASPNALAQQSVTLVENYREMGPNTQLIPVVSAKHYGRHWRALSFKTGGNYNPDFPDSLPRDWGYTLDEIRIVTPIVGSNTWWRATLYRGVDSGRPNIRQRVAALSGSVQAGVSVLRAPSNTPLDSESRYSVVLEVVTDPLGLHLQGTQFGDRASSAPGWAITADAESTVENVEDVEDVTWSVHTPGGDTKIPMFTVRGRANGTNTAPEFPRDRESFTFEPLPLDTDCTRYRCAVPVSARLSASDRNNDGLEYSLSGTDADSFTVDRWSGQIRTKPGFDYSGGDTYRVILTADDRRGGTDTARVTLYRRASDALWRVSVNNTTASETRDDTADFTVNLTPASRGTLTVDYATADGTAVAGDDYESKSGTLRFAAGETSKTVSVPIIDDDVEDSGEKFTLTLSNPTGGVFFATPSGTLLGSTATATATIWNTETPPAVTAVRLVADASDDRAWTGGERIEAELRFSEIVTVAGGHPWVEVSVGGFSRPVFVGYASGSGTDTLVFSVEVPAGARYTELAIVANSLTAGATDIVAARSGRPAELAHDGTEPTVAPETGNGGVADPPSATFDDDSADFPTEHDGSTFTVGLSFSEELSVSYTWVRDTLVTASGGTVRGARRATAGSNVGWRLEVEPDSTADVTLTIADGLTLGDGRTLAGGDRVTVRGPAAGGTTGPTATFDDDSADFPTEHDGSTFTVPLSFSEEMSMSYAWVRDTLVTVTGGAVERARRATPGSNVGWRLDVEPDSTADVTLTIAEGLTLTDGRTLVGGDRVTVRGPTPSSGLVDGALLMLTWASDRDGFGAPGIGDYRVTVNGQVRAVTSAALAGPRATLVLARPVEPHEAVTVSYVGSAMHPLADATGETLSPPWSDLPVTNATGLGLPDDAAAPVVRALAEDPVAAARDDARWLSAAGRGLADLEGLRRLAGLRRLDLSDNAVVDLDALANLGELRRLDLSGNRVTDLRPLAGLHELRRLDLTGNRVGDLTPLAELARLEVVLVGDNVVTDLGPLLHLGTLEHLGLSGNRVVDVEALADLWSLRRLDLSGNPVADLSPLGDLETLVALRLPAATVGASAATLGRLTRLRWVSFGEEADRPPDR